MKHRIKQENLIRRREEERNKRRQPESRDTSVENGGEAKNYSRRQTIFGTASRAVSQQLRGC